MFQYCTSPWAILKMKIRRHYENGGWLRIVRFFTDLGAAVAVERDDERPSRVGMFGQNGVVTLPRNLHESANRFVHGTIDVGELLGGNVADQAADFIDIPHGDSFSIVRVKVAISILPTNEGWVLKLRKKC